MARMPSLNLDRGELEIPYMSSPIPLGQVEVPFQLGRYIATGLNCLDKDDQRWNFTCKVVEWMQVQVVEQIVHAPTCVSGFSGILPFILSVQKYSDNIQSKCFLLD